MYIKTLIPPAGALVYLVLRALTEDWRASHQHSLIPPRGGERKESSRGVEGQERTWEGAKGGRVKGKGRRGEERRGK